ncbi:ethanolamine ammonia-lyase reactivating factor EutA [Labrenzia sp. OB1]|uniref:ethanolamine ammonia-lyase reactivating factor EutA n=1 Tax=Labrenzia sp. OB1 TaxID=1561204 RepID=UPI0008389C55|nr:ethanolamine ammonia-lyase reactivating factor EutA [Labrenzia sp. OB1]
MISKKATDIDTAAPSKDTPHSIDDHMFGDFYPHDHDGDADHDHDDISPGPLEDNPIWQRDNVMLTSVGIDIGSAGTQVIFSNVHLQRVGSSLASKYVIIDRATAFESEIAFTPFADATTIDGPALGAIIDKAYRDAKVLPSDIDAGVVILTGEALRRENAEAIAGIVAEKGGDFVTATAGNHMEAMLAAYGSGAAKASHDSGRRILNVDIGGGTTKLALCEAGKITWTGALHIGGRLIATEDDHVVRMDPAGRHHASTAGYELHPGMPMSEEDLGRVAETMIDQLTRVLTCRTLPADTARLFLTDLPENLSPIDGLMFSGGVGEYVYERETRSFGDLGLHLGKAIRARASAGALNAPILPAVACIRATALGASEYSVQLSGQTSTITSPSRVLPRRNMPVLKPYLDMQRHPGADQVADAISKHFEAFDMTPETRDVALVFEYRIAPDYLPIRALADGIATAMAPRLAAGHPLYVIIDGDIAQTLGGILRDEIGLTNDLLVLDGLSLRDFDYIDLGKIRLPSFTVPVTVKSLLFAEDPRGPRGGERIHFQSGEQPYTPDDHSHGHHHHHGHGHTHSHATATTPGERSGE